MVMFTVLEPIKMTMQKGLVGYITPKPLATGTNFVSGSATANKRTAAGTFTYTGNMATDNVSITIPTHTTGDFCCANW